MQQTAFADHWLVEQNVTKAAVMAGYSEKTAGKIGHRLFHDPLIQTYINERRGKIQEKLHLTQEMVIAELWKVAKVDIRQFFDDNGRPIPVQDLPDEAAAAMAGIEVEVVTSNKKVQKTKAKQKKDLGWMEDDDRFNRAQDDEVEETNTEVMTEYKFKRFDKIRAAELICDIMGFKAPVKKEDVTQPNVIRRVEIVRGKTPKPAKPGAIPPADQDSFNSSPLGGITK